MLQELRDDRTLRRSSIPMLARPNHKSKMNIKSKSKESAPNNQKMNINIYLMKI